MKKTQLTTGWFFSGWLSLLSALFSIKETYEFKIELNLMDTGLAYGKTLLSLLFLFSNRFQRFGDGLNRFEPSFTEFFFFFFVNDNKGRAPDPSRSLIGWLCVFHVRPPFFSLIFFLFFVLSDYFSFRFSPSCSWDEQVLQVVATGFLLYFSFAFYLLSFFFCVAPPTSDWFD